MRTTTFAFVVLEVERIRQASWNMAHNDGNRGNITFRRNMPLHQLQMNGRHNVQASCEHTDRNATTSAASSVQWMPRLLISYCARDTGRKERIRRNGGRKMPKCEGNALGEDGGVLHGEASYARHG